MNDLRRSIAEMKADVVEMRSALRNDHAQMAGKMKDDLGRFLLALRYDVSELRATVSKMKESFRDDHAEMATKTAEMAKTTKENLGTFAHDLSQKVAGLRERFSADIVGARRFWSGPSRAGRKATREAGR
jgi:hypothetical protein